MSTRSVTVIGLVIAGLILLGVSSLFVVHQAEQVLVLRLGAHRATIKEPGLHFKLPFIEDVVRYDLRLLGVDPSAEEITLGDQKRVVVDTFTRYLIHDPLKFYQTLRTEMQAQAQLSDIISSSVRRVMGQLKLPDLLSSERAKIMEDIRTEVALRADALYGVTITDVRVRRADLPEQTSQSIYDRMKSERERQAKELRAQGYEWGQRIRAQADRERTVLLAEADRDSNILRAQGDAESAKIYNDAYGRDPKFYDFYRSLEAYRKTIKPDDTAVVLSPDSAFLHTFSKGAKGTE